MPARQTEHDLIEITDYDGTPVVGVKLSNIKTRDARVYLHKTDYEKIVAKYGIRALRLHGYEGRGGYVEMCGARNKIISLLPEIAGKKHCRLRDNNPLNLRRSNIALPTEGKEQRKRRREQQLQYWNDRAARVST